MTREDALRFIDAYADNELDVKDALEVQAWIEKDETCRAEHDRILAAKEMLRRNLGDEDVVASDLLRQRVKRSIRREGLKRSIWFRPSVAAAAMVAFMVLGWTGYQRALAVPEPLVSDTMMIYQVETGNPLDVRSNDIQKVSSWVSQKLQQEVSMPKLEGEMLGARLCPFASQKGAMVRYRHKGKNLALFIGPASGIRYSLPFIPSFKIKGFKVFEAEREGYRLAFWKKGLLFYALVHESGNGKEEIKNLLSQDTFKF